MITEKTPHYYQIFRLYTGFKTSLFSHRTSWLERIIKNKYPHLDYKKLEHQRKIIENSIKNIDTPINLFIVGEGKYGKSSLINALAGIALADVDFLPKTWRIDIFKYGNEKAVLTYNNGKNEEMSIEKARELVKEEEKKAKAGKDYESPVLQIIWHYKSDSLRYLNIVDTPGIKQIRTQKTRITIEEHYYKADGVLWLLDGTKINSEVTEEFLGKLLNYRKKIIGVVNKWDRINSDDEKERVLIKARECFGQYFNEIIPVSAKNGFTGKSKGDKGLLSESNILLLEEKILEIFGTNGKLIKNISIYYNFLEAMRESREILKSEESSFTKNWNTYCRTKEKVDSTGLNLQNSLYSKIKHNMSDYFQDIYRRIESNTKFRTVEKELYPFIIGMEKLNERINLLKKEMVNSLKNGLYNLIQTLAGEKYEDLAYDYDGSLLSQITIPAYEDMVSEMNFNVPEVNIVVHTPLWSKTKEWMSDKPLLEFFINKEQLERDLDRLKLEIRSQISPWEEKIILNFNTEVSRICRKNFKNLEKEVERKFHQVFGNEERFVCFINEIKDKADKCNITQSILTREFALYLREISLKAVD